jgi:4-hydroxybenzoate polyprenyltransferase
VPEGFRVLWVQTCRLLELIRFSHTVFALPFALMAALLAWRESPFRPAHLLGLLLCMVFARSAAMAFNRLVDREYDARNPRTRARHLPAGLLSVRMVRLFLLVCCVGFVASTLLFLPNRLPVLLSVPVLAFLLGYSYAKRWTSLCHYWLSAALMLSPIAAWIAIRGDVDWPPALLAAAVFFWVGGFDILYAAQDVEFDQGAGLFSLPSRLGVPRALWVARFSHLLTVVSLAVLWRVADLGPIFAGGVIAVAVLLAWEHWLVRAADLSRINLAFFRVNAVISLGLLAVVAIDLWAAG